MSSLPATEGCSWLRETRKYVAPEVVIGARARHCVPQFAANFGARKVLFVTDQGLLRAGWACQVEADLANAGLPYVRFDEVTPNPRAEEVMAGAESYLSERCDGIIVLGGGSAIDCAKGIGIVAANGGRSILDFEGVDNIDAPSPPIICIPSTCSGADVSQFAIITDLPDRRKLEIVSKAVVTDVACLDPEVLTTMSSELTSWTTADALSHAIESYVSKGCSPVTDVMALNAIGILGAAMAEGRWEVATVEQRANLQVASLEAGLAFSNTSLGLSHAMGHAVGGLTDAPHGCCSAALLRAVIAFNFRAAPERYRTIAASLGLAVAPLDDAGAAKVLLDGITHLLASIGLDITIGSLGVTPADIPDLVDVTLLDACCVTNPRSASHDEIELLYESAL